MINIKPSELPKESILFSSEYDFSDSFVGSNMNSSKRYSIEEITKLFFETSPKWIDHLFEVRNKVVKIFGLKVSDVPNKEELLKNTKFVINEEIGLFKIFDKSNNEIILGQNDKHLNFKISILSNIRTDDKQLITISTLVYFNKWYGKLYFQLIRPFHKLIVPLMLKNILKNCI